MRHRNTVPFRAIAALEERINLARVRLQRTTEADPAFERALSQFEKKLLPFKLLLEELEGWERHVGANATQ